MELVFSCFLVVLFALGMTWLMLGALAVLWSYFGRRLEVDTTTDHFAKILSQSRYFRHGLIIFLLSLVLVVNFNDPRAVVQAWLLKNEFGVENLGFIIGILGTTGLGLGAVPMVRSYLRTTRSS